MFRLVMHARHDERGSALVTALLCTMVMLALGLALLSIVDTQASESGNERTRDHAFNLSESVLSSQAFVLARHWPSEMPAGEPLCSAAEAGFGDIIGSDAGAVDAVVRLRRNLNASSTDIAYEGASWQVNMCDDDGTSTVWDDTLLTTQRSYDKNKNNRIWVRAQSTVRGKTRALVGLVRVRTIEALNSKYGLVAGGLTDDLGTSVNSLSTNALGGVLSGLLGTTPTVAADPTQPATTPPSSGVTGLRCGALDVKAVPTSTCVAGTIGAAGALPALNTLLTNGRIEQFPTPTTATPASISQLRAQAVDTKTYYTTSEGAGDTSAAGTKPCTFTTNSGTRTADTVVFIEKVGNGNQYCSIDVTSGVQFKALVIGSGRVIIRGNGNTTAAPSPTVAGPQTNTFSGVVYALNLQRHPVADGGMGLGDDAAPGRVVIRIDSGAHVKGSVNADGKSGKVAIYPPPVTINTNALVDTLIPCSGLLSCTTNATVKALGGVTAIVDELIRLVGLQATTNAILDQTRPQRAQYGSAITSDVAAIKKVTVYGTAGVVAGTFRDLSAR